MLVCLKTDVKVFEENFYYKEKYTGFWFIISMKVTLLSQHSYEYE